MGRGPGSAGIFDFSRDNAGPVNKGLQPLKSYATLPIQPGNVGVKSTKGAQSQS